MKYNTLIKHRMRAIYMPWEPQLNEENGYTYRHYDNEDLHERIYCTVIVSIIGNIELLSEKKLQGFSIIRDMTDAAGVPMMEDQWYSVQRSQPVLGAAGTKTSYRHTLAAVDGSIFGVPIDVPPDYPDFDQAPGW